MINYFDPQYELRQEHPELFFAGVGHVSDFFKIHY